MATKPAPKGAPSKTAGKPAPKPAGALVTNPKGGAVANPMELLKAHAARGMQQLAKMPAGGTGVSFRGGTITIGGVKVGNTLRIIPLAPQFERSFYDRDFDPADKSPPDCYSYDNEYPHEKAASKQAESCARCPRNEWNSGPRGKGKACKEGSRLAFLRADGTLDADIIRSLPILTAKFSVMNTGVIQPVLAKLYETVGHPAGMVCELSAEPDEAWQIRNGLQPIEPIDPDWQEAVVSRLEAAEELVQQPYPEPDDKGPQKPQKPPQRVRKF